MLQRCFYDSKSHAAQHPARRGKEQRLPDSGWWLPPRMGWTSLGWYQLFAFTGESEQAAGTSSQLISCRLPYKGRGLRAWCSQFYQHHICTNWGIFSAPSWFAWYQPCSVTQKTIYAFKWGVSCTSFILRTMKLQGFPSAKLCVLKGKERACRMDFMF